MGVPVYDADSHAKKLMTTDGILVDQIKKEFGILSYDEKGGLNRKLISEAVFNDEVRLSRLNSLVHPRVAFDYDRWLAQHEDQAYVVKEAALLFESGSFKSLDKVIVVTAPEQMRVQRVLNRDTHRTEQDVLRIMSNQWPEEEKVNKADYVVRNDETTLVLPQVLRLDESFRTYR